MKAALSAAARLGSKPTGKIGSRNKQIQPNEVVSNQDSIVDRGQYGVNPEEDRQNLEEPALLKLNRTQPSYGRRHRKIQVDSVKEARYQDSVGRMLAAVYRQESKDLQIENDPDGNRQQCMDRSSDAENAPVTLDRNGNQQRSLVEY